MTPTHRSDPMTDKLREAYRDERVKRIAPAVRNWLGDKRDHRSMEEVIRAALAAAPQPAPEREVLVEVINAAMDGRELVDGEPWGAEAIADALLARGLRLPGGDETMAWAVLGNGGRPMADAIYSDRKRAHRLKPHPQARIERVAIRVVEGGDDE